MILLQASGVAVTVDGQTIVGFFVILLSIFGVAFGMIRAEGNARQRDRDDFAETRRQDREEFIAFKATILGEFRLMQVRYERASQVGIVNALDILADPNPWTEEEMAIRNRMRQNPDFRGITDREILKIIRRLDIERPHMSGDKLMACDYMLRELNGELARRAEEQELRERTPFPGRLGMLG